MIQEAKDLKGLVSRFRKKKIMLIGDLYLDEYLYGTAVNISREGHALESRIEKHEFALGGAANTANNLKRLGAEVTVIGVAGDDFVKNILFAKFRQSRIKTGSIVIDKKRKTNHYIKIRGKAPHTGYQLKELLRTPQNSMITKETELALMQKIKKSIKRMDAIVVTEQMGGAITQGLLARITSLANQHNIPIIGDSRSKMGAFMNFSFITPNDFEAAFALEIPGLNMADEIGKEQAMLIGKRIVHELNLKGALITRGKDGMIMFNRNTMFSLPSYADEIVDVTGAGDTVTAAFALALAAGASPERAAVISNAAAAVAVKKPGTAAATPKEVMEVLTHVKR
ncbi:hypothetical protein GF351_04700 [Candidatus Woesearchaeota archaeon]|nr:hypothetical protein [Candidatus Woesearchaeota archaeon]